MKSLFKIFLFLIVTSVSTDISAQGQLNFSKSIIRKELRRYCIKYPGHTNIIETDSTIYFTLVAPSVVRSLTELYHFDRFRRCDSYARSFDCDSCLQKSLKVELYKRLVIWTQLTPTLYVAKFKRHRILEIIKNSRYSYVVRRSYFTRKEYDQMIETKTW